MGLAVLPMFVSHRNYQNLIPLSYGSWSLWVIFLILLLLIIFSLKKKGPEEKDPDVSGEQYFTIGTTSTLKGIAILFLIVGHFSNQIIEGGFLPTYWAGRWALIIFLFVSGIGLTKKYGLNGSTKEYLHRRIKKIIPPLWITLLLFYILDYWLLGWTFSTRSIIFHFLGIIDPGPPNGPDWFISYIAYLYLVFYVTLLLTIRYIFKFLLILFFRILQCSLSLYLQFSILSLAIFYPSILETGWNTV